MSSPSRSKKKPDRIFVDPLSAAALRELAGPVTFPVITYAGYLRPRTNRGKPKLIAYGGLAWRYADKDDPAKLWCEMWFNIAEPRLMRTLTLVRWAKRMLRTAHQLGESVVFCVRDDERPQSETLLRIVGMTLAPELRTFGEGAERHGEVWTWRRSLDSEQP